MNILLYPNLEKTNGLNCTIRTVQKLRELGATPLLDGEFRHVMADADCTYGKFSELLARCDVIVPIGGDGTFMRAARHAAVVNKPLLAVNAGRVGFLTQVEFNELDRLNLLVEGKYIIQKRMMLEAELEYGNTGKHRRYTGLNDIVISRSDNDHIVDIHVDRQGTPIAKHRADGLIFATPTGSTAYSLSAGGPIVDPGMNLLLMTTICSHSTWGRGMVLPADCEYTVTDHSPRNSKGVTVTVDGRRVGKIHGDQALLIRKSASHLSVIDLGLRTFFENVNAKLS